MACHFPWFTLASEVALVAACFVAAADSDPPAAGQPPSRPPLSVLAGSTESMPAGDKYDFVLKLQAALDVGLAQHDPIPTDSAGHPAFTYHRAKTLLTPLINQKVPVILWWSVSSWDYSYLHPDLITLEDGKTDPRAISLHDPAVRSEDLRQTAAVIDFAEASGADIRAYVLLCASNYGEVEHVVGNWFQPQYGGYSKTGRADFQRFLRLAYHDDIAQLNRAWGKAFTRWDEIELPRPNRKATPITFDGRPEWSDYSQWRTFSLTDYMRGLVTTARQHTTRDLEIKASPYYQENAVGPFLGHLVAALAPAGLGTLDMTDGHSIADLRYGDTVRRFYHVPSLIPENNGFRYGLLETRKALINSLMSGCDAFNYCQLANLDAIHNSRSADMGLAGIPGIEAAPNETYYLLAEARRLYESIASDRPATSIAFLHSAYTGMFRAPSYSNWDVRGVYDDLLSDTCQLASWGVALGYPDIVDEQLIRDGCLEHVKMLIVPNTSITTLPDDVLGRLRTWIDRGGWLVATGTGCFLNRLQDSRVPRAGDGADPRDLLGGLLGTSFTGTIVKTAAPVSVATVRRPEGTSVPPGSLRANVLMVPAPGDAVIPLVADDRGRCAVAKFHRGKGGVLFCTEPVPLLDIWQGAIKSGDPANVPFFKAGFALLLRELAGQIGIQDFAFADTARVSCRGLNRKDGKHLFVGAVIDPDRPAARFTFPAGIAGPAELLLFSRFVATAAWTNGVAVAVHQTSERELLRDPTNSLSAGTTPLVAPYARISFDLPGSAGRAGARPELEVTWK